MSHDGLRAKSWKICFGGTCIILAIDFPEGHHAFAKSSLAVLGMSLFCIAPSAFGQYKEIEALASNIAGQIPTAPNKTVAVVDFTDLQGNSTELGRFLAEELSIALPRARSLQVIDRMHLKALLQEHKLAATGIIDQTTQRKLEIAGVQVLVTGTITPFGDSIRCAVKALDLSTARVEAAATAEIPRTKTIDELLSRGVSANPATPDKAGSPPKGSGESAGSPIRRVEGNAEPAGTPPAHSDTAPPSPPLMIIEAGGFSFALVSCSRSGDDLFCKLRITNRRADRRFAINANYGGSRSRIIDRSGREFLAGEARVGANSYGGHADTRLVSGVPVATTVAFFRVPSDLSSVALFEVNCYAEGVAEANGYFRVQFRNFSVSSDQ
jgi:TolB-like protein